MLFFHYTPKNLIISQFNVLQHHTLGLYGQVIYDQFLDSPSKWLVYALKINGEFKNRSKVFHTTLMIISET